MFLHPRYLLDISYKLFLKILSSFLCFKFFILDEHVNKNYKSLKYPSHYFRVFLPNRSFFKDRSGNADTLLFCVILAFAPDIKYVKIRVENFDLHLLIMSIYAKAMLCKFLSWFFVIAKHNCWPTYLEREY